MTQIERKLFRKRLGLVLCISAEFGVLCVILYKMFEDDRSWVDSVVGISLIAFLAGILTYAAMQQGTEYLLSKLKAREVVDGSGKIIDESLASVFDGISIPQIRIMVTEDPSVTATAFGAIRGKDAIVVSSYLLKELDGKELEALILHEYMHLKNKDPLLRRILLFSIGLIGFLAYGVYQMVLFGGPDKSIAFRLAIFVFWPVIPFVVCFSLAVAFIIQLTFDAQEYIADLQTVQHAGNARELINVLQKLERNAEYSSYKRRLKTLVVRVLKPSLSVSSYGQLFSSHPSSEERIASINEFANSTSI